MVQATVTVVAGVVVQLVAVAVLQAVAGMVALPVGEGVVVQRAVVGVVVQPVEVVVAVLPVVVVVGVPQGVVKTGVWEEESKEELDVACVWMAHVALLDESCLESEEMVEILLLPPPLLPLRRHRYVWRKLSNL